MSDSSSLESMVEELCNHQLQERELADTVLDHVKEHGTEQINDMPLLYRIEVKRILESHDENRLANAIKA